jgi:hypothetical protein
MAMRNKEKSTGVGKLKTEDGGNEKDERAICAE